jgi:hypothetical protein
MVAGVDTAPVERHGDISLTGIFFELEREVGAAGSVQWLRLTSLDRRHTVEVLARVIRSITLDDLAQPEPRFGVAFEFMPDSAERFASLQNLVGSLLHQAATEQAAAEIDTHDLPRAAVFHPRITRMYLEANWPVRTGEIVQVVFRSPGTKTRIPFEGQVVAVQRAATAPGTSAYDVEVELRPPGVRAGSQSTHGTISESVDLIFNVLLDEASEKRKSPASRKEHLVGLLSRISITSLLSLFDLERVSGHLRVKRGDQRIHIYVREGQIVDAVRDGSTALARDVLRSVVMSREGTFDFTPQEIDRPDRIGLGTTALMLELAREHDESESGDVDLRFDGE